MIKWKLRQIMFEHRITSKALAESLGISQTAMCYLRNSELLPELGSEKLCKIAKCLSALSGASISPLDLIEYAVDQEYNLSIA